MKLKGLFRLICNRKYLFIDNGNKLNWMPLKDLMRLEVKSLANFLLENDETYHSFIAFENEEILTPILSYYELTMKILNTHELTEYIFPDEDEFNTAKALFNYLFLPLVGSIIAVRRKRVAVEVDEIVEPLELGEIIDQYPELEDYNKFQEIVVVNFGKKVLDLLTEAGVENLLMLAHALEEGVMQLGIPEEEAHLLVEIAKEFCKGKGIIL
ncbi:MAG: hypothetical protein ACFFD2_21835 [Promethearchaeota archaeon]